MVNFLLPMIRRAGAEDFELRNRHTGRLLAHTVLPAFDSDSRRKGLLGRDSLAEGVAMIIAPTNAIHTFGMRFPIDVLFVHRNGAVVKIREHVRPWRLAISQCAYAVVELPAGTLEREPVAVGDVLAVASSSSAADILTRTGEKVRAAQTPVWAFAADRTEVPVRHAVSGVGESIGVRQ